MNSEPRSASELEAISQSIEQVHALISILEEQVKLGLFFAQVEEKVQEVSQGHLTLIVDDDTYFSEHI
jgi:hypothetical protein